MANFDIGAGITDETVNQFISVVYTKLRSQVFTGSVSGVEPISKMEVKVSWDVEVVPTLSFKPKTQKDAQAMAEALLAGQTNPPEEAEKHKADHVKALADALVTSCFELNVPKVKLTVSTMAGLLEWEETVGLTVLTQILVDGNKLTIAPLKVTNTGLGGKIEWAVNEVVLPELRKMIPAITIPAFDFEGISLAPPLPFIADGRAVGLVNRSRLGAPTLPSGFPWPESQFSLLLKPDFIAEVINTVASGLSHPLGDKGRFTVLLGDVKYGATAIVSNIQAKTGSVATELDFSADVTGNVRAGFKPYFPPFIAPTIGVNYTLNSIGKVTGRIGLKIVNGNILQATTVEVAPIFLQITPSGGIVEWVLSAISTPLLQALSVTLVPLITSFLGGLSFNILEIKDIPPIQIADQTFTITPGDMVLNPLEGNAAVTGKLSLS